MLRPAYYKINISNFLNYRVQPGAIITVITLPYCGRFTKPVAGLHNDPDLSASERHANNKFLMTRAN